MAVAVPTPLTVVPLAALTMPAPMIHAISDSKSVAEVAPEVVEPWPIMYI